MTLVFFEELFQMCFTPEHIQVLEETLQMCLI